MAPSAVSSRRRSVLIEATLGQRVAWITAAAAGTFLAVSLLTFDAADPPSHVVAVHNTPIANLCGSVGATIAYWTYHVIGYGAWILLAGIAAWVVARFRGIDLPHTGIRALGLVIMALSISCMHELLAPGVGPLPGARAGLIAQAIVSQLTIYFSGFGTFLAVLAALAIGLVVAAEQIAFALPRLLVSAVRGVGRARPPRLPSLSLPRIRATGSAVLDEHIEEEDAWEEEEDDQWEEHPEPRRRLSPRELREKIAKLPVRMASNQPTATDEDIQRPDDFEGYEFPSLDLLADPDTSFSDRVEEAVRTQAAALESALQTFDVAAEVVGIEAGPTVTLYSLDLAPGTKVSRINTIASDLARTVGAPNIRIVPNTAGRTTVGIEVPNTAREIVCLKELMSCEAAEGMRLPMFLGKDASGEPLVADLTRMPHMLVAGTTGSGKSVCINSVIAGWMYTRRPDELKLILVDPKMVELSQERYGLFRRAGVRDIVAYNDLDDEVLAEIGDPEAEDHRDRVPSSLPYIVFIIDELADLMMTSKEVEQSIVRIAQKARAVGIHLLLATQRPEAKVVTGLIKSNMPCRVSFKVSSSMDSRIVLDTRGAELLLGDGDMLYVSPGTTQAHRAQGTYVSPTETRAIVGHLTESAQPNFERSLVEIRAASTDDGEGEDCERDAMFDEAVRVMIDSGRGSVSLLQRRLGVGYGRASRLVDQMAMAGIVGDHKGSVAREVLITMEEWDEMTRLEDEHDELAA